MLRKLMKQNLCLLLIVCFATNFSTPQARADFMEDSFGTVGAYALPYILLDGVCIWGGRKLGRAIGAISTWNKSTIFTSVALGCTVGIGILAVGNAFANTREPQIPAVQEAAAGILAMNLGFAKDSKEARDILLGAKDGYSMDEIAAKYVPDPRARAEKLADIRRVLGEAAE